MNKILAIAQKEWAAYFKSPVAYVLLIVTISVFNLFFFIIIDTGQEATLRDVFAVMEFLFVFIIPLLTMKSFAEEKAAGTMEFLMTTPTSNTAIVLGKYLGGLAFFSLIILASGVYYGIIEFFGSPDRAAALSGYLGILLEGAFFIAFGLLISSLTRSQMVAAMCSYGFLFLLYFSPGFLVYLPPMVVEVVRYAATSAHSANFFIGAITPADLVYYLSGIVFCLVLTRLTIENRIWR